MPKTIPAALSYSASYYLRRLAQYDSYEVTTLQKMVCVCVCVRGAIALFLSVFAINMLMLFWFWLANYAAYHHHQSLCGT